MKGTIEKYGDVFLIRISGSDGRLWDIQVVDELELKKEDSRCFLDRTIVEKTEASRLSAIAA